MTRSLRSSFGRPSLRAAVRQALKTAIIRGRLKPGERLGEEALAVDLEVSRTPLREALVGLEREGFVLSLPGRGFFVRELSVDEIEQNYPIIDALEALALRTSPEIDDSRIRRLEQINAELVAAVKIDGLEERAEECVRLDRGWHSTLVAACPNPRLLELLEGFYEHAARYEFAYWSSVGSDPYSTEDHAAIIAALVSGDRDRAQMLLANHWQTGVEAIARRIG